MEKNEGLSVLPEATWKKSKLGAGALQRGGQAQVAERLAQRGWAGGVQTDSRTARGAEAVHALSPLHSLCQSWGACLINRKHRSPAVPRQDPEHRGKWPCLIRIVRPGEGLQQRLALRPQGRGPCADPPWRGCQQPGL